MPFPCQNGCMGVEMQVLVQISPILLFSDRFRVKPYPLKQKKGVEHLPLKDLMRGPVCWAKMVHFWKPQKHAFWPSPECREPFSMLPTHTLSSFMVWNAGVGPWWAATAEIFKGYGCASSHRIELFPAKRGAQNRTLTPEPQTFTKCPQYYCKHPW